MDIRSALKSQYHAAFKTLRPAVEKCPDALWDDRADGARHSGASYITRYFIRTSTCNRTNNPSSRGPVIAKKRFFWMPFPGTTHALPSPVTRLRGRTAGLLAHLR